MQADPLNIPQTDLTVFNANRLLLELPDMAVRVFDDMEDNYDYTRQGIQECLEENGVTVSKRGSGSLKSMLLTYAKLRGRRLKTNTKDHRYKKNGVEYLCFETTMFQDWERDVQRRAAQERHDDGPF